MPPWCEGRAKCTVPNPHGLLDILSAGCPDIGLQKVDSCDSRAGTNEGSLV